MLLKDLWTISLSLKTILCETGSLRSAVSNMCLKSTGLMHAVKSFRKNNFFWDQSVEYTIIDSLNPLLESNDTD